MSEELSLQAVAERTGASMEQLREWRARGLISRGDTLSPEDAERVRLVCFLVQRGFSPETIGRAERSRPGLLDDFLAQLFPDRRFPVYTIDEAAERSGLDVQLVQRLWEAIGLRELGYVANDDDVVALRALATALGTGLPESALVETVRVYVDALRRVAEMEVRLVHFHLHERLRAAGVSAREAKQVVDEASEQLLALAEPAVMYFHRKGWASALRDDLALHVAEEAGVSETSGIPGTLSVAVVFADLSRFTSLTEAMGDAVAAEIVERYSRIVRTVVGDWHGRVAKQIGDAYMLVFLEPHCAVACALEIERRAAAESHFPAVRAGAHWGPALYREGDYVGATVNLASRLAGAAEPHQVLVTAALCRAAADTPDVEFIGLGSRALKGLGGAVELFAARRTTAGRPGKAVDPVCGMELDPGDIAASLNVSGQAAAFCSNDCLQRFVADPHQYAD